MADGAQAGATVDRRAVVIAATKLGNAGVHADTNADLCCCRPHGCLEVALDGRGGRYRPKGVGEHQKAGVTLTAGPYDPTAGTLRGLVEHIVVKGHGVPHRRLIPFPEARASLDVGQNEGDGSDGEPVGGVRRHSEHVRATHPSCADKRRGSDTRLSARVDRLPSPWC